MTSRFLSALRRVAAHPAVKRCPTGLAGAILLIFVFEWHVKNNELYRTPEAECWRLQGLAAYDKARGKDILCLGDSLMAFSIWPGRIERGLHSSVYNLSVMGGTPVSSFLLLRRALDSGARPSEILIDLMPFQLVDDAKEPGVRLRCWPELVADGDIRDLAADRVTRQVLPQVVIGAHLPSFRSRLEIGKAIVDALRGIDDPQIEHLKVPVIRRHIEMYSGAMVIARGTRTRPDNADSPMDPRLTAVRYDRAPLEYADRILRLARDNGITVYCILPPISPEYQARCDRSGASEALTTLVDNFKCKYDNFKVIDVRWCKGFEPSAFVDAIHLDRVGSARLTDTVIDAVRRLREVRYHWFKAERMICGEEAIDVEDFGQSLQFLANKK